jgi:hypothetical protein
MQALFVVLFCNKYLINYTKGMGGFYIDPNTAAEIVKNAEYAKQEQDAAKMKDSVKDSFQSEYIFSENTPRKEAMLRKIKKPVWNRGKSGSSFTTVSVADGVLNNTGSGPNTYIRGIPGGAQPQAVSVTSFINRNA